MVQNLNNAGLSTNNSQVQNQNVVGLCANNYTFQNLNAAYPSNQKNTISNQTFIDTRFDCASNDEYKTDSSVQQQVINKHSLINNANRL